MSATEPAAPVAATTHGGDCPMCHKPTLHDHCPSPTCNWWKCRNERCDAMLSPVRSIGTYLDPKRQRDPKTNTVRRLRLIYSTLRGWHLRDNA